MVNLELYKAFYVVAKCGSLTKASEQLYISQPAVSQAIKQLEQQIGGKLFNRTPKGMELTKNGGEVILPFVEKAITLINEAEDKFKESVNSSGGTLKIGASDTLCKNFLLPFIKSFTEKNKEIFLTVTNRTTSETLELLKSGKVDIAFVNLPLAENNEYIIEPVKNLNDVFVASDKFSSLKNRKVPLDSLEDFPVLMLEQASNTRRAVTNFINSMGVNLTPEIELGSLDLLVDFAKIGMGIACVPREYVENELKSGELFEIDVTPCLPQRSIALVLHEKGFLSYIVKEFIKEVKN